MKSTIVKLIVAFIAMLFGTLLLYTTHHWIPLFTGAMFCVAGFSYIAFKGVELIGYCSNNVFEFSHYYYRDEPSDCESVIKKTLSVDERTQLLYYDPNLWLKQPILIDELIESEHGGYNKVMGWVKAKDRDAAIKILQKTENWLDLQ